MTIFASILTILKSIPALVQLLNELASWLKFTFGDNPEKFLADSADAFRLAREAKNPEERLRAAQNIATLIRRL